MSYKVYNNFPRELAPTIAQYTNYEDLLANSEQVPLTEFQQLTTEHMPRFADGLFDLPPGPGLRRKRKRLADFSEKEKQARRKLKNRIAAQSARDRKRHEADQNMKNMEELENEVLRLREENKTLRADNQTLRAENANLRQENMTLRQGKHRDVYYSHNSSYNSSPWQSPSGGSSSFDSGLKLEVSSPLHPIITTNASSPITTTTISSRAAVAPSSTTSSKSSKLVDPRAVELSLSNTTTTTSCVHSSNTQLLQVVGPADGLPMPQGRSSVVAAQTSSRKVAIRASKTSKRCYQAPAQQCTEGAKVARGEAPVVHTEQPDTPSFAQVQALYTLVMTILFQTAGTMINKHASQSQCSSRELSRRLRAVRDLRESKRQRLSSPIKFWETENLHQVSLQAEKSTAPFHYQPLACRDKSATRPSSMKSSRSSRSPPAEAPTQTTTSTPSSWTTLTAQTSSTGGKGRQESRTNAEVVVEATVQPSHRCPLHARTTTNCLACQCDASRRPISVEPKYLSKLNISDHLLRQATLQVQRKRSLKRQNSQSKDTPTQQLARQLAASDLAH